MKKILYIILLLFLLGSIVYAIDDYTLEVQNYPYTIQDWRWGAYFNPPYTIIINGYMFDDGIFNEKMYKEKLSDEIAHALCWKWFKNLHCNDEKWKQEHCEKNWCI